MKVFFYRKKQDDIQPTATQKRLFKVAYEYAIQNKKNSVVVNKTRFDFDFVGDEVFITSPQDKSHIFCFGFSVIY